MGRIVSWEGELMRYWKVVWHHDFADEPVLLYSEIDDAGMEIRKVEVYRDGGMDYADSSGSTGTMQLRHSGSGRRPMPDLFLCTVSSPGLP